MNTKAKMPIPDECDLSEPDPDSNDTIFDAICGFQTALVELECGTGTRAHLLKMQDSYDYCVHCALVIKSEEDAEILADVKKTLGKLEYLTSINPFWVHPFLTQQDATRLIHLRDLLETYLENLDL